MCEWRLLTFVSIHEQELCRVQTITCVGMTIVYNKSYRVDGPSILHDYSSMHILYIYLYLVYDFMTQDNVPDVWYY